MDGTGSSGALSRDEIVVDSTHAQRVVDMLGRDFAGVLEVHPGLGLSRLALVDLETLAQQFGTTVDAAVSAGTVPARPRTPLEQILAGVRVTCAAQSDGWMPTMGKNRVLLLGGESVAITVPRSGGYPDTTSASGAPLVTTDLPAASTAGAGVVVGLLDTAVPRDLALDGRIRKDSTRLDTASTWTPPQGHGAFTAGLVHRQAGAAGITVRGILAGRGTAASAWEVAVALVDLVAGAGDDLAVVNMSLGCFTDDGRPPLVLERAVSMVRDQVLLVAAAGNHGSSPEGGFPSPVAPLWPAALPGVVAVGGRAPGPNRAAPADYTPKAPWVQVLADGTDVVSDYLSGQVSIGGRLVDFGGVARWTGGSMAAANAAGRFAALGSNRAQIREAARRILAGEVTDDELTVYRAPQKG